MLPVPHSPVVPSAVADALAVIRGAVRTAEPTALVVLYPMLCELAGLAFTRLLPVSQPEKVSQEEPDEAMTAGQCARESGWRRGARPGDRGGFSPRWLYDHADELPFRIGGAGRRPVRFSRRGFRAWLRAR